MSTDECSSNESGWTTYIVSPYQKYEDRDDYDDGDEDDYRRKDEHSEFVRKESKQVDSDDSMASDASSGPRGDRREGHLAKHQESKKKRDEKAKKKKAKDKADMSGAGKSKKRSTFQIMQNLPISFWPFAQEKKMLLHHNHIHVTPSPPKKNLTRRRVSASISGDSFSSRGFTFHRTTDNLNLDHLNSVFAAVGFPRRDPVKIRTALDHTDAVLWVEYEKTSRPVAFARATGDGVFNAIIWDVVVDPSFQGIGLGKAVMERLVTELLEKGISNIALYSEPRVLGFYRPLGFVADPDGITGMVYSRKKKKKN